jgi:hypothetical protein
MKSEPMNEADLRKDANWALRRFAIYRDLPRDQEELKRLMGEYSGWLCAHCRTQQEVDAVIDRALQTLKKRPTLAEMNEIWTEVNPPIPPMPVSTMPELSPEEREQQREFQRNWYAEQLEGAPERKRNFIEARGRMLSAKRPMPTQQVRIDTPQPITPEDVKRALESLRKAKETVRRHQRGPGKHLSAALTKR